MVQITGSIIPFAGVVALLRRKSQNSSSMYLMVANMGCLLMNGAYLLLMDAETASEAVLISKMEYLGNVMFYYFFVVFLASYFWKKYPKWLFHIWACLEGLGVLLYWSDTLRRMVFGEHPLLRFEQNDLLNVFSIHIEIGQNVMYIARYSLVCVLLNCLLIYSIVRLFLIKDSAGRKNMGRLVGAQFVILQALNGYMFLQPAFDFVPIMSSLAVLSIIRGVINDEFFGITEMGHEWVFEQMEDAFVIVDRNYGYLDANSYALMIFDELKKKRKHGRISEELRQMFTNHEEICRIDGMYYEKKIVDIMDKGKAVGYSMLLVDVTKQQELMEQVQEEKERADAANQAKSAFVSNVSHEIRTPMNAIVGMTQILLRKELPKQERDYIVNIQNSGNALLTIINDLLDMSKIESGKMELVEEDYNFMDMLDDLGMILLNRIGSKPVELIFDIDSKMPAKLHGDALRIRQVIINLMNNATKFTEQGYVCLSVCVEKIAGDDVELAVSVKDSGQGIREEDLPKLFGSFQQVDTKKNHHKEGTGLGLSISKQLVELMNGSIGVRSEYGKGSEFYFTIHQGLVDGRQAVEIADAAKILIAGRMKNPAAYEALQRLAESCQMIFVPDILSLTLKDTEDKKLYYFTDCYLELSETEKARLIEYQARVYGLQNPMVESEWPEGFHAINKPLYSDSFCRALTEEAETQEQETTQQDMAFTVPGARILVVDDNEINRMVVEELLKPLEMQIDMAENGAEAVQKVQETEYDMILMDHIMPVMDGIRAAQEIRKLDGDYYRNVPIIALTANTAKEQQEEYLRVGMNDFVAKPISMEDICSKIQKWIPEKVCKL